MPRFMDALRKARLEKPIEFVTMIVTVPALIIGLTVGSRLRAALMRVAAGQPWPAPFPPECTSGSVIKWM